MNATNEHFNPTEKPTLHCRFRRLARLIARVPRDGDADGHCRCRAAASANAPTVTPLPTTTGGDSILGAEVSALPRLVGDQYGIPYGPEPYQVLDLRLPDPIALPRLTPRHRVRALGWLDRR